MTICLKHTVKHQISDESNFCFMAFCDDALFKAQTTKLFHRIQICSITVFSFCKGASSVSESRAVLHYLAGLRGGANLQVNKNKENCSMGLISRHALEALVPS